MSDHGSDSHTHDHDDHHSPEAIKRNMRRCYWVLGALMVFTIVTVIVAYIPFNTTGHIVAALLIATFKASLVALFFMHLWDEKFTIYQFMFFTAFFAFGLFALTYLAWWDPLTFSELKAR
jgi:cytochrome c oxidase subunit IV